MLSIQLPETLEQDVQTLVQEDYDGDWQAALSAFIRLHEKYGWKNQLLEDVKTIRQTVRRQGGIKQTTIDETVTRYRRQRKAARA